MPHLRLWNLILWSGIMQLCRGQMEEALCSFFESTRSFFQPYITRAKVESAEENPKHAALLYLFSHRHSHTDLLKRYWGLNLFAEMCSYARQAQNCNERVFSLVLLGGYLHILCFLRASWYSLELISSHLFVLRCCERITAGGRRVQNTTAKLSHHFTML